MRVDHAAGETFFANQDGDGQQENIDYFDAGSASSPGAPGAANADVIKLRNDSPSSSKEFVLSIYRESLPASWIATINNGNPVVTLGPGQEKNIPFKVKQTKPEAVGTTHSMRIYASSRVTFHHFGNPADAHNGYLTLGGVQVKVAVLRKPKLACRSIGNREVIGKLTGVKSKLRRVRIYVVGLDAKGRFIDRASTLASVPGTGGAFKALFPRDTPPFRKGICLFAGTMTDSSAASPIFLVM